jgi:hypothetical protein
MNASPEPRVKNAPLSSVKGFECCRHRQNTGGTAVVFRPDIQGVFYFQNIT